MSMPRRVGAVIEKRGVTRGIDGAERVFLFRPERVLQTVITLS